MGEVLAADLITERLSNEIDRRVMNMNGISGSRIETCKIPMTMRSDRDAVEVALSTIGMVDSATARVVRIKSTLELDQVYVSLGLIDEVSTNPRVNVVGKPEPLRFDGSGNLL